MKAGADVRAAQAEALALQAVMIAMMRRMLDARPDLAPVFCAAFEDAERLMSGVTMKIGESAPRAVTVGALEVIEQIRIAVITDESICSR